MLSAWWKGVVQVEELESIRTTTEDDMGFVTDLRARGCLSSLKALHSRFHSQFQGTVLFCFGEVFCESERSQGAGHFGG